MSGWKSTKDGKHFKTKSKPGINSDTNNNSHHSGSQPSSMQTERKKIDRLKNQIKITQTAYDVVKAHEKKNFLKGNPDRKLYGPDVVPHFNGSIKLCRNLFDRERELLDAEADMRYAKAQQKRSSN